MKPKGLFRGMCRRKIVLFAFFHFYFSADNKGRLRWYVRPGRRGSTCYC